MENIKRKYEGVDGMKSINLVPQAQILKDGKLYFSPFLGKDLFCFDFDKVDYLESFSSGDENHWTKFFVEGIEFDSKLYFIPTKADKIEVYDLKNNQMSFIELDFDLSKFKSKFSSAYLKENTLYLFPTRYEGIISINLSDGCTKIYNDWISSVNESVIDDQDVYCGYRYAIRDNSIFIPVCKSNKVLEFDLVSKLTTIHKVDDGGFSTICDDGEFIWLFPRRGNNIVKWNPETGLSQTISYNNIPNIFNYNYIGAFFWEGFIYAFPEYGNKVLKIRTETNEVYEISELNLFCENYLNPYQTNETAFVSAKQYREYIIASGGRSSELVVINLRDKKIMYYTLQVPMGQREKYNIIFSKKIQETMKNIMNGAGIPMETNELGLSEYIDFINFKE